MIRLYTVVFLSGAALMGLEIVGSRVMAPVFGTSIFVWGALITTFLASLSTGYALGGKIADRRPSPALLGSILDRRRPRSSGSSSRARRPSSPSAPPRLSPTASGRSWPRSSSSPSRAS